MFENDSTIIAAIVTLVALGLLILGVARSDQKRAGTKRDPHHPDFHVADD